MVSRVGPRRPECHSRTNAPCGKKEEFPVEQKLYTCPKCGCTTYEHDQFQATGGNFAKVFDIQNKKFTTITCTRCGYTELYKQQTDDAWNILDFLIGN